MSFINSKMTAEQVQELLGMTPTELKEKLDKVGGLETSLAEANTKLSVLDSVKASIDALTNKFTTVEQNRPTQTPENKPDGNNDEELDFVLNPADSTQKLIARALSPIQSATLDMHFKMALSEFKGKTADYGIFAEEIQKVIDSTDIRYRAANPELFIKNVYNMVRGQHFDEAKSTPGKFFVETGGNQGGTRVNPADKKLKPEEILTPEQLKQAEKWGVTPADWVKELDTSYV